MNDSEWRQINKDMIDFKYCIEKLDNQYLTDRVKEDTADRLFLREVRRTKRIKDKD